jgi:thioredoxin 1
MYIYKKIGGIILRILQGTTTDFSDLLNNGVTIVHFFLPHTPHRRMMKQFFHQASKEFKQEVTLIEVDGEKNKEDILRFSVVIAPTILVFKDGEERERLMGINTSPELINSINRYCL